MKKFINAASVLVLTMIFALSALAQSNGKKAEMFGKIAKLSQTKKPEDQQKAYEMSKDFIAQFGKDDDDQVKKIKDFVEKYKVSMFNKNLDDGKTAEAFALGKEILAQEPENTYIIMNLAYGGYDAFNKRKDKSFSTDAVSYAKQALSLFEAGKLPTTFDPFKSQAEATATMYYIIGSFGVESDPVEAAKNFYKSLQYDSKIKNTSYPYYVIAYSYEKAYEKMAKNYQELMTKNASETELLAEQDKMNLVVDRMLDAYARAIKVAETDNNPGKADWKKRFTDVYKYRKQSDSGMDEYLNSVMSKPLPDPNTL